jgi:hypothetical protein
MSDPVNSASNGSIALRSERVRLARLARDAALRVPGVMTTDAGPIGMFITVGGGERLEGVTCVATNSGAYEVTLRLVCALVPLVPLGERIKALVASTAAKAGIELESVSVQVAAVAGIERQ